MIVSPSFARNTAFDALPAATAAAGFMLAYAAGGLVTGGLILRPSARKPMAEFLYLGGFQYGGDLPEREMEWRLKVAIAPYVAKDWRGLPRDRLDGGTIDLVHRFAFYTQSGAPRRPGRFAGDVFRLQAATVRRLIMRNHGLFDDLTGWLQTHARIGEAAFRAAAEAIRLPAGFWRLNPRR